MLLAQEQRSDDLAALAPFINEQTIAVARIDLKTLDLLAFRKQFIDPVCRDDEERAGAAAKFEKLTRWVAELHKLGGDSVYLACTLENMRLDQTAAVPESAVRSTFAVIPGISPGPLFDELNAVVQTDRRSSDPKKNLQCRIIGSAAVVAPLELFDKLSSIHPKPRADLAKALAIGNAFPVSIAIVPPPVFALAAEQIITQPAVGTNKSWGNVLGRGLQWLGAGVQPNLEKLETKVVIQSVDAEAAEALSESMRTVAAANLALNLPEGNPAVSTLLAAQIFSLLPKPQGDQLVLQLNGERATTLGMLGKQIYANSMKSSWQGRSMTNLKQIALAILNYEDKFHQLPDRAIRDVTGKPLLSWRVAVLPDLDNGGLALYKQFHLDEPWDSEHNRKLIEQMPETYRSLDAPLEPGKTRYLGAVGEHCAFPPDRGIKYSELTDGTSNTILVVEAAPDRAVIWTKPDDLEVDLDNPWQGLGSMFLATFADGHSQGLSKKFEEKILRALFTRDAGDSTKP
jgi:hypothetical protein